MWVSSRPYANLWNAVCGTYSSPLIFPGNTDLATAIEFGFVITGGENQWVKIGNKWEMN